MFSRILAILVLCFCSASNSFAIERLAGETKTILINGFGSNVPAIGHGLETLQKSIPGSTLYSYVGPVDGLAVVAPQVLEEVRTAHASNPETEINIIGVSFGANLATRLIATFNRERIPISYLGIIDGLPLAPVTPNVRRVDNFTCVRIGCLRDKVRLTKDNTVTLHFAFEYDTNHIDLPAHPRVHDRIISQISTYTLDLEESEPTQQ